MDYVMRIRRDAVKGNLNAWQLGYKYSIAPETAAAFLAHATMGKFKKDGSLKSGGYSTGNGPVTEPPMRKPKKPVKADTPVRVELSVKVHSKRPVEVSVKGKHVKNGSTNLKAVTARLEALVKRIAHLESKAKQKPKVNPKVKKK